MLVLLFGACAEKNKSDTGHDSEEKVNLPIKQSSAPSFTIADANKLIALPLHCVETEYPNKLGQTIGSDEDLKSPTQLHPIFYGCFDWHSAVHGYWSMVTLLKTFPEMDDAAHVREILMANITSEKIELEVLYFEGKYNKSYERTYGWAWLLKLAETLKTWDDPMAQGLYKTLQPLTDVIVTKYLEFLPKLVYPIRVGEHTNTAFGLTFAYDYAVAAEHLELKTLIENRVQDFYLNDSQCPIQWEPSGYDFLSPCLEEIDIMRRVLEPNLFKEWLGRFMPQLANTDFSLDVGEVSDRTDGKLVHLDGLNFSRAWVLYGLANQYPEFEHLKYVANNHIAYSYPNLVGDSYEGGHWLGSFAIYALETFSNK
ncbi:MAG: DUF2891 domain-containing protein [Flavobacteriaceae bacterium]|nr:DUF2891 domain-containing protein [Flavobacteriaceae bacterium]